MAETSQLKFNIREIGLALIEHEGIKEGRWQIGIQFELGAGNVGPAGEMRPSAFVRVTDFLLTRTTETDPAELIIDASEARHGKPAGVKRKSKSKAD